MKLKSIPACTALIAVAMATDHGVTAAGTYQLTQLDATSGLPRGAATGVSDNGVVIGRLNPDEGQKAFVWTSAGGLQVISFGGTAAAALAVSPNGIVVGASDTAGDADTRGFVWTAAGGVKEIAGLGGTLTLPWDVNSSGLIVGESTTSSGEPHAFLRPASGDTVDLGTPGSESRALFVSESGLIVGDTRSDSDQGLFAITPAGSRIDIGRLGLEIGAEQMNRKGSVIGSYIIGDGVFGSFFWSIETGLVDLQPPGGTTVAAVALSETDIVAGYAETASGSTFGFVWTPSKGFVTIPTLGGDSTYPNAVNSNGLVAGISLTAGGLFHAFAWTEAGGIIDLGTLKSGAESYGELVTEDGTITGTSEVRRGREQHAFTWTAANGMQELPSLGGRVTQVLAANPSGVLVGLSSFDLSKDFVDERAVVWTPAPFGTFSKLAAPPAVNRIKAGKTIDLTFSLGGNLGLDLFADGYPASRAVNCDSGAAQGNLSPLSGSLSYDARRDSYTYAWQTDGAWDGCRQVVLQLDNGTSQTLTFRFK